MSTTEFDVDAIVAGGDRAVSFAAGDIVYRAGDASDRAYIVQEGRVEIRQKRGPVETLCPGEIFGELGLIDGGPRTSTAVAVDSSRLVPIDAWLFGSLIRDDEEFTMTVLRLMARRHRATIGMFQRCLEQPATPAASAHDAEHADVTKDRRAG